MAQQSYRSHRPSTEPLSPSARSFRWNERRILGMVAVVLIGMLAAGCSGTGHEASPTKPSGSMSTSSAPGSGPTSPPSGTPASHASAGKQQRGPSAATKPKPTRRQSPGNINQTVAPRKIKTAKPVPLAKHEDASFGPGLNAKVTRVRQAFVRAKIPGQVSGSSVIFDLAINNRTNHSIDLNPLVVNVIDSRGVPAQQITSTAPAKSMPNELAAGRSATGTYVFVVPKQHRASVRIQVVISARLKVVEFDGSV